MSDLNEQLRQMALELAAAAQDEGCLSEGAAREMLDKAAAAAVRAAGLVDRQLSDARWRKTPKPAQAAFWGLCRTISDAEILEGVLKIRETSGRGGGTAFEASYSSDKFPASAIWPLIDNGWLQEPGLGPEGQKKGITLTESGIALWFALVGEGRRFEAEQEIAARARSWAEVMREPVPIFKARVIGDGNG